MSEKKATSKELEQIQGENSEAKTSLTEIYKTTDMREPVARANELFMLDLIKEQAANLETPITSSEAKKAIFKKFCDRTNKHINTARFYYERMMKYAAGFDDFTGIIKQNIQIKYDIMKQLQEVADEAEKASEVIQALKGKGETSKNLVDLVSKLLQYETNKEKNTILLEKVKSDTALGSAQLALNFEGTKEQKKQMIVDLLKSKKSAREVLNELKKNSSDGFEASVVENE